MTDGHADDLIPSGDPAAIELLLAVRGGDVGTIRRLIGEHPDLPSWRIGDRNGTGPRCTWWRTGRLLPCGPEIARLLIDAGADPNGGPADPGHPDEPEPENPLHWAASSDDVAVAAALIDGGADIEAPSAGPIAGPPLVNAVAYGCWQVARLLVARGARIGSLWQAAASATRPGWTSFSRPIPPRARRTWTRRSGRPATAASGGGRVPARPGAEHRRHA